jgi:hypothetical protein
LFFLLLLFSISPANLYSGCVASTEHGTESVRGSRSVLFFFQFFFLLRVFYSVSYFLRFSIPFIFFFLVPSLFFA